MWNNIPNRTIYDKTVWFSLWNFGPLPEITRSLLEADKDQISSFKHMLFDSCTKYDTVDYELPPSFQKKLKEYHY